MTTHVVATVSQQNIQKCLNESVSKEAILCTDEHPGYTEAGKKYFAHYAVKHSAYEYTRKEKDGTESGVNHCESFFSLLKRGVHGAWHHVSREHLHRYANEFSFRWNTRDLSDGARMETAVSMFEGKRLTYRQLS